MSTVLADSIKTERERGREGGGEREREKERERERGVDANLKWAMSDAQFYLIQLYSKQSNSNKFFLVN